MKLRRLLSLTALGTASAQPHYSTEKFLPNDTVSDVYPRWAVQWPRPRSGYVPRTSSSVCLAEFVSPQYTSEPIGDEKIIMDLAFQYLQSELTIWQHICPKEGTVARRPFIESILISIVHLNVKFDFNVDESYEIILTGKTLTVKAATVYGARHAITTLHNMQEIMIYYIPMNTHGAGGNKIPQMGGYHFLVMPFTTLNFSDGPRLPHRGIMIDVARSFLPRKSIYRTIRAMSRAKLNVLHIHASDDQSFPVLLGRSSVLIHGQYCPPEVEDDECCAGTFSRHHVYRKSQMEKIVEYGRWHGVRVILEFDRPGHAYSWGVTKKEYIECYDLKYQTKEYCDQPLCAVLALNRNYDGVFGLTKTLTDEWLLVQQDSFMHYGMSNLKDGCWGAQKKDELRMKFFEDSILHLQESDPTRRMVVWQDALETTHAPLPDVAKKVVVQVWDNPDAAPELLEAGHDIIWSGYETMNLDCGRSNTPAFNHTAWCGPYTSWWNIYKEAPDILLASEKNKGKLIGGEVILWSDSVNEGVLDSLLWPRAAAWAGAAWEARTSPMRDPVGQEEIKTAIETEITFRHFTDLITSSGVAATPVQYPQWCVFHDDDMCEKFAASYLTPDEPDEPKELEEEHKAAVAPASTPALGEQENRNGTLGKLGLSDLIAALAAQVNV